MSILLNQKEECLSIELTPHGRKKLGMGVFQPKYFSFFDDEIIYDQSYNNISEDTNHIQDRILNESLSFRAASLSEDYLTSPLGDSDIFNEYAPSWDLVVLNGKINYDPANSTFYKKIFNLKNIQYDLKLIDNGDIDNKELNIKSDYFLIDLKEMNVDLDFENFEIEIFMYDEFLGGKNFGIEIPLMFEQTKNNVINDILYDDNELQSNYYNVTLNNKDVFYYYDVLVDDEIDEEFIVVKDRVVEPGRKPDIYISDLSRKEDTEKPNC